MKPYIHVWLDPGRRLRSLIQDAFRPRSDAVTAWRTRRPVRLGVVGHAWSARRDGTAPTCSCRTVRSRRGMFAPACGVGAASTRLRDIAPRYLPRSATSLLVALLPAAKFRAPSRACQRTRRGAPRGEQCWAPCRARTGAPPRAREHAVRRAWFLVRRSSETSGLVRTWPVRRTNAPRNRRFEHADGSPP